MEKLKLVSGTYDRVNSSKICTITWEGEMLLMPVSVVKIIEVDWFSRKNTGRFCIRTLVQHTSLPPLPEFDELHSLTLCD